MGPRADYVCTRCEESGQCSADQPWRDLPVKDARCPKCGAKKFMQRLYSGYSPMISTNGDRQKFKAADDNAEGVMLAHDALKDSRLRAEKEAIKAESVVPGINMRVRAISTDPRQMAQQLGGFGAHVGGVSTGKAQPAPMQDPTGERMAHGANKIIQFGRQNSILDPTPSVTREVAIKAVGE